MDALDTNMTEKEETGAEEDARKRSEEMTTSKEKPGWFKRLLKRDSKAEPFNPNWLTEEEYTIKADASVATTLRFLTAPSWRLEKRGATAGDVVQSISDSDYGKIYKFTGTLDCPAKWFFEYLRDNFLKMPSWNPTVLECHHIKRFHPGLDLSYQVTAGGGGGLVSERDFVLLRRSCGLREDGWPVDDVEEATSFVVSGVSVEVPGYAPLGKYVRGDTKIGSWFLKPANSEDSQCLFEWLFCCDLKGSLPTFVADTAFATVMLDSAQHIRRLAMAAKQQGLY